MHDRPNPNDALYIRIDLAETLTSDLYEWILRPFWAEEYQKLPGSPGLPGRFTQFSKTRKNAISRLKNVLGIVLEHNSRPSFFEFLHLYENGGLPIRCGYNVSSIAVVTTLP